MSRPKRNKLWLAPPIIILIALVVGGVWYCLPYFQGEAEYQGLRELSAIEETVEDVTTIGMTAEPLQSDDPLMERQIDWNALRAINPDVIGWIYVPNTSIDYPICQDPPDDPGKYLHTTFEGAVSWPNNEGCIYLDCGNIERGFSSEAPLLYGHYQLNQGMFSQLAENYDLDTLNSRNQVYIYTPEGAIHIELFAARIVNANAERIRVNFADKADLNAWLDEKLASANALAYDPGEVDQLWTFCVCSYGTWANQRTLSYGRTVEDTRAGAVSPWASAEDATLAAAVDAATEGE